MTPSVDTRTPAQKRIAKIPPKVRKAIAVKASRAAQAVIALHRQRIEATGISFAEHQRKLNRLRVQRWREKQAKKTSTKAA